MLSTNSMFNKFWCFDFTMKEDLSENYFSELFHQLLWYLLLCYYEL